jgi:hypothetical protein
VHISEEGTALLLSAMLQLSEQLMRQSPDGAVLPAIVCIVERLIAHVLLPRLAVDGVVVLLCHLLNVHTLCERVWRVTRTLFTSHMRFAAVHSLCALLSQRHSQ